MGVRDILAAKAYVEFDADIASAMSNIKKVSDAFKKARAEIDARRADRNAASKAVSDSREEEKKIKRTGEREKKIAIEKIQRRINDAKKEQLNFQKKENALIKANNSDYKKLKSVQKDLDKLRKSGYANTKKGQKAIAQGVAIERELTRRIKERQKARENLKKAAKAARSAARAENKSLLSQLKNIIRQRNTELSLQRATTAMLRKKKVAADNAYKASLMNFRAVEKEFKAVKDSVRGMKSPLSYINSGFRKMTKTIYQNRLAILALAASMTFMAKKAIDAFKSVDVNLLAVKGITRASGKEFSALTQTVLNLGRTTSFTATQVAEAAKQLSKAGFSAAQIQASLAPALDLSRATGASLEDTSAIVARTLSQFNLSASDTTRVVDVLGTAVNSGVLTLEDMAESMKFLGPVGDSLGFKLEEVASSFTVLANNGLRGGVAARQLKRALTELSKDDKLDLLRGKGVEPFGDDGNAKPFSQIIEELGAALQQLNPQQQLNFLDKLFGEGTPAMAALTRNTEDFLTVLAEVENSKGNMDKLARTIEAGLTGSILLLLSAVESLSVNFTKLFEDQLIYGITLVKSVVSRISEWVSGNDELKGSIMSVAQTVWYMIKSITKFIAIATGYITIMKAGAVAALTWKGLMSAAAFASALMAKKTWTAVGAIAVFNGVTGGTGMVLARVIALLGSFIATMLGVEHVMGGVGDSIEAAMADAQRAVENLANVRGEGLSQPYMKLIDELKELNSEFEKTGEQAEKGFNRAKQIVRQLEAALGVDLGVTLDETNKKLLGLDAALAAADRKSREMELRKELQESEAAAEGIKRQIKTLTDDYKSTGSADFLLRLKDAEKSLEKTNSKIESIKGNIKNIGDKDSILQLIKDTETEVTTLQTEWDKLQVQLAAGSKVAPKEVEKLEEKLAKTKQTLASLNNELVNNDKLNKGLNKSDLIAAVAPRDVYGNLERESLNLVKNLKPLEFKAEFGLDTKEESDKLFASVSGSFKEALEATRDLQGKSEEEIRDIWSGVLENLRSAAEEAVVQGDTEFVDALKTIVSRIKEKINDQINEIDENAKNVKEAREKAAKDLESRASRIASQVSSMFLEQKQGALGGKDFGFRQAQKTINLEEMILQEEKKGNDLLEKIKKLLAAREGLKVGAQ